MAQAPYWSEAELEYIRLNYARNKVKAIAKKLGRTESSVRYRAYLIRQAETKEPLPSIDAEQKRVILLEYGRTESVVLATRLGLSVKQLQRWAERLSVKANQLPTTPKATPNKAKAKPSKWSAEEVERLMELWDTMPLEQLATELGKTPLACQAKRAGEIEKRPVDSMRVESDAYSDSLRQQGQWLEDQLKNWRPLRTRQANDIIQIHTFYGDW